MSETMDSLSDTNDKYLASNFIFNAGFKFISLFFSRLHDPRVCAKNY